MLPLQQSNITFTIIVTTIIPSPMPSASTSTAAAAAAAAAGELLSQAGITSSEQLVKALKAPEDPTPSRLSKIELARAAWVDTSLFVPKKAELISDWLLESLAADTKGKGKAKAQPPRLTNPHYWSLLHTLITAQLDAASESRSARQQTINRLAATVPLVPLATHLAASSELPHVISPAASILTLLLPPASSRSAAASIETVTEAITAWLHALPPLQAHQESLAAASDILHSLVKPWSTALDFGANNAKKNHRFFLANSLPPYFSSLSTAAALSYRPLLDTLELVGSRSLFTTDVLLAFVGQYADPSIHPARLEAASERPDTELLNRINQLASHPPTLEALPTLIRLFTQRLRLEAPGLLAVPTLHNVSAAAGEQVQQAVIRSIVLSKLLGPLTPLLRRGSSHTRSRLLTEIDSLDLYVPGNPQAEEWLDLFQDLLQDTIAALQHGAPTLDRTDLLDALRTLWRLEQSIIEPRLTQLLQSIAAVPVSRPAWNAAEVLDTQASAALSFLATATASYTRARDVPALVLHVVDAAIGAPHAINGVLFSTAFASQLAKAITDFLTPSQLVPLLQALEHRLAAHMPQRSSKRHKSDHAALAEQEQGQQLVLALGMLTIVLSSVPIPQPVRDDALAAAEQIHNDILLPCIDSGGSVVAAALRARAALLSRHWRIDPTDPIRLDGSPETEALPCLETSLDERSDALISLLSKDTTDPAVVFETLRTLLLRAEHDSLRGSVSAYTRLFSESSDVASILLRTVSALPAAEWDGRVDHQGLGAALWLLVTTRFAELLDTIGAPALLSGLASVLVRTVNESSISRAASRSAYFLELPRWRAGILGTGTGTGTGAVLDAESASFFPVEYLPRSLLERALAADAIAPSTNVRRLVCAFLQRGGGPSYAALARLVLEPGETDDQVTLAAFTAGVRHLDAAALEALHAALLAAGPDSGSGSGSLLVARALLATGKPAAPYDELLRRAEGETDPARLAVTLAHMRLAAPARARAEAGALGGLIKHVCAVLSADVAREMIGLLSQTTSGLDAAVAYAAFLELGTAVPEALVRVSQGMAVGEYDRVLRLVLAHTPASEALYATAVLMLQHGPEGSSRVARAHVSTLLSSPGVSSELLSSLVVARPRLLRPTDVGLLLPRLDPHAPGTVPALTQLCTHGLFLPQLAHALSRLAHHQLGAGAGAGAGAGRDVSRLLETAAPHLSKHAPRVLAAFLTVSALGPEIRPGLMALCSRIGKHERDALLRSLDALGQSRLRKLWKEYERERYRGA